MKKYKIAFLLSHSIQYFSPLFREMAKHPEIDLIVYYCSDECVRGMKDVGFGKKIKWDIPLLEGYKYRFLKNYSPKPSIFAGFFGLINPGIIKELREEYDALIVHGWNYFTNIVAIITAKLFGVKVFIRGDNPLNQELRKPRYKILIKKIILKRLLFRIIDAFLYVGQENKEFYRFYGVPESKLFFVPHAVENGRFIKGYEGLVKKKDELKNEIGIPQDKVVILFSGKLIDKKRPMDLLMGYEKISSEKKALVYVGDGPYHIRENLEEYVKEKKLVDVYFVGFKNQTGLPKYYVASDIFVLPSVGETWGLVVNEAMCFHLPVIVSDMVGCGRDLVKHGENGFVYPVGNIDRLANYLLKLLMEPNLRKRMGKHSSEIITKWSYKEDIEGILVALKHIRKD